MSTPPPQGAPGAKSPWTPRRIVLIVLVAYAVLLALFNLDSVAVNFVFFKTSASLFVVIVLSVGLGFLAGWLFDDVRERRRRKSSLTARPSVRRASVAATGEAWPRRYSSEASSATPSAMRSGVS